MTAPIPTRPRPRARRAASALAAAALLVAGCGGPSPCVVSGKVLVDDRPAEGVYVVFRRVDGPPGRPESGTARSRADGSFSLVVDEPGESVVTAFWPTVTVKDVETIEGPDRFRGAYADPQRPVAKPTIRPGDNALPPIPLAGPSSAKSHARGRGNGRGA